MIKFAAHQGERKIVGFGLTRDNVNRLIDGKPIHAWLEEMGLPKTDLLIFFGETEQAMAEELKKLGVITEETILHVDPKLGG